MTGGGTQVRVRASTGWFVVVGIFGWGRGGGGGRLRAGLRRQRCFLLTPRSRARAAGRDAEGVTFSHTHTPDCSFPFPLLAPSPANFLCQAGAAAEAARAQSCQRHPATAANFVARAAGGAARGCRPSASSAPFAFPSSAPLLLERLQSLPLLLLFLIGSRHRWSEREGRRQCERKLEGGLRGGRETAENGA